MRQRGVSGIGKSLLLAAVLAAGTVNLSAYKSPSPHGSHSYGQRGGDSLMSALFGPSVPPAADYLARTQPPAPHILPADPDAGAAALSATPPFVEPSPSLEGFLAYLESERTDSVEKDGPDGPDEREGNEIAATGKAEEENGGDMTAADADELSASMLEERAKAVRVQTASRLVPRLFPAPDRTRLQRDWLQLYFPVDEVPENQQRIIVPVLYDSTFLPPGQEGMRSRATIRQEP